MAKFSDLFTSKADGSLSITKTAVFVAHVNLAVMFVHLQWGKPFNDWLWYIYAGATIFHASYDKTMAIVSDLKKTRGVNLS